MQPASAGGSVRLAMSSVYATSKCMLDYYRKGNIARDEPQLVRAYDRKNFDPVIKEWKWPDFGKIREAVWSSSRLTGAVPYADSNCDAIDGRCSCSTFMYFSILYAYVMRAPRASARSTTLSSFGIACFGLVSTKYARPYRR